MMLAFTLDGLANSHPIRVPVNHPDEINEIFDYISYNKVSWLLFESSASCIGCLFDHYPKLYLETVVYFCSV